MKRSGFVKISCSFMAGSTFGLSLLSCSRDEPSPELKNPITIDLNDPEFADLAIEGEWLLHPDFNVLLVNVNEEIRAFSSVCPHQQCTRRWSYRPGVFTCGCHFSKFDSTGQYLSGPAKANLREYTVIQDGAAVTVG